MTEQNIHGPVHGHIIGGNLHIYGDDDDIVPWHKLTNSELRQTIQDAQRRHRAAIFRSYFTIYSILFASFALVMGALALKMLSYLPNAAPQWLLPLCVVVAVPMLVVAHCHGQIRRVQMNVISHAQAVIDRARLELELRRHNSED